MCKRVDEFPKEMQEEMKNYVQKELFFLIIMANTFVAENLLTRKGYGKGDNPNDLAISLITFGCVSLHFSLLSFSLSFSLHL